ncbi:MAG: hypothetical protein BWZ10_03148 [candidate division BRC1 bacterium ADurb.BinA364]|nr:MAG: hypothetical protein BWZ10_03148 [candidate division BRC1 bacterium ADurb.BinA364]
MPKQAANRARRSDAAATANRPPAPPPARGGSSRARRARADNPLSGRHRLPRSGAMPNRKRCAGRLPPESGPAPRRRRRMESAPWLLVRSARCPLPARTGRRTAPPRSAAQCPCGFPVRAGWNRRGIRPERSLLRQGARRPKRRTSGWSIGPSAVRGSPSPGAIRRSPAAIPIRRSSRFGANCRKGRPDRMGYSASPKSSPAPRWASRFRCHRPVSWARKRRAVFPTTPRSIRFRRARFRFRARWTFRPWPRSR